MKIAVLTRGANKSPKILANSLQVQLQKAGTFVEVFYDTAILNRMVSLKDSELNFQFWLRKRVRYFFKDLAFLKKLKDFDAIIISETIPNAFFKSQYNIEKLKRIIQKPIGLYAVYYLGNAPTQIEFLKNNNEPALKRFDFHLSVSGTTEIKQPFSDHYFPIGLKGDSFQLKPEPKDELIAIVDFVHPGNELYRKSQVEALEKAGIKYIALEGSYTIEEIRNIYQQGSIYFMQSSEAFGLPILECLSSGCQIFTPESWWPMSWRLNERPEVHSAGILPECFTIYEEEKDLIRKLEEFKNWFNPIQSPQNTFKSFLAHYPSFYTGNSSELRRFINDLQKKKSTEFLN